jgi:hypothetical protein
MAFKMKGISSLTNNSLSKQIVKSNSPLLNTDPSGKSFNDMQIEVTNSVKDLQGDDFATERIITKKGQEVEKQLVPEDFEGGKNNPEYQKKLAALKIAMEQGKDDKYKDQEIKQKRSYDTNTKKNVKTYPNPNTKNGMWGTNFEGSKKKDVTFDYAKKQLMRAYKDDPAKGRRAVRAWAKSNGITLETAAQAKKRKASNKKIITTIKSESKGNWETL